MHELNIKGNKNSRKTNRMPEMLLEMKIRCQFETYNKIVDLIEEIFFFLYQIHCFYSTLFIHFESIFSDTTEQKYSDVDFDSIWTEIDVMPIICGTGYLHFYQIEINSLKFLSRNIYTRIRIRHMGSRTGFRLFD